MLSGTSGSMHNVHMCKALEGTGDSISSSDITGDSARFSGITRDSNLTSGTNENSVECDDGFEG